MVGLDLVKASNAQLKELGPNLVALFVGGTSGIGAYTAKEFVKNTFSPRVYLVGRNQEAAERIIQECKALNKDGKVEFMKANVSELAEVDRICTEIKKKEKHINLLVQTQSNIDMKGRNESPEGIDRKFTLNFYSRMRFLTNLLPLLRAASETTPHFSRSLSVLGAGHEGALNFQDLDLKTSFSPANCANHTIVMNDFMAEEFAAREPAVSFTHSSPSVVSTGIWRDLPFWARIPWRAFGFLLSPLFVGAEETGHRQLFIATSALYPPKTPFGGEELAKGINAPWGSKSVMPGADGAEGSGSYVVNWDNEVTGKEKLLREYREKGTGKIVWEHTMGIFERVEKLNRERAAGKVAE